MVINSVVAELRAVIIKKDYRQVEIPIKYSEIPVGRMNQEEKAIYSLLLKNFETNFDNKDRTNNINFLIKKLVKSLKRFGEEKYSFRSDFVVVTKLDISRLIWRPYSPNLN